MISSLPGKTLRTLIDITRLAERFNMRSRTEAEAGKFDIKRRKPGILLIILPTDSLFKIAIMTYFSIFVLNQRH